MLTGKTVRLEPLELAHGPELWAIGFEPSLWELGLEQIRTPEEMNGYIDRAKNDPKAQAFAVRHLATNRLARSVSTTLRHKIVEFSEFFRPTISVC